MVEYRWTLCNKTVYHQLPKELNFKSCTKICIILAESSAGANISIGTASSIKASFIAKDNFATTVATWWEFLKKMS